MNTVPGITAESHSNVRTYTMMKRTTIVQSRSFQSESESESEGRKTNRFPRIPDHQSSTQMSRLLMALVLTFLLLCQSSHAFAGSLTVSVRDEVTGQPMDSCRITIPDAGIAQSTNRGGRIILDDIPPGVYTMVISTTGYRRQELDVSVQATGKTAVNVALTPEINVEEQITVVPEEREIVQREMSAISVAHLAGGGEDPFKAMQTTPGVLALSEGDSRLYIRGSPPSENLVLLDGVPIYDPYRLFGLVTLFDPQTVSFFSIWPGGFPARYGNRLSAVVEVYNRYGTTEDTFSGSINTSFTSSSLLAEGKFPLKSGDGSWLLTMRRTYYDVLLNLLDTGPSRFPYFFDVQGRLFYQPSERNEFSFFTIYSHEGTDISDEFESEFSTVNLDVIDEQDARVYALRHLGHLTPAFVMTTTLSLYSNRQKSHIDVIAGEEAFRTQLELDLQTREYLLQEDLEFAIHPDHTLEAGFLFGRTPATSVISIESDDPAITIPPELAHFQTESENDKFSYYLQDSMTLLNRMTLTGGIRYDQESLSGFEQWSPRLNLGWSLTDTLQIQAAVGLYYHFPSYESLQGDGLLFDLENLDKLDLKPERAFHYILGLEHSLPGKSRWSVELYYKELEDLIVGQTEYLDVLVLNPDGTTSSRTIENTGITPGNSEKGYAQGIELLMQQDNLLDRLSFQISYALAETRAREDGDPWHYRRYDQRHSVNIIGEWTLNESWRLNAVWKIGSGFPYTSPGEILIVVEDRNGNGQYDPRDGDRLSYLEISDPDRRNAQRFPFYHRLDVRLSYAMKLSKTSATFYLDIINLYDQKNIQSYEYNRDYTERKEVEGLPFLPTFGVHVYF